MLKKLKNLNNYQAFSLVEISIVIVIVGILIAGISKAVDLYDDFKLFSARKLTVDSRVGRIPDLSVWWESTLERSFNRNEAVDGASISNWYDVNPSSNRIYSASVANPSDKPKYKANVINKLPAVVFNNSYLEALNVQLIGNRITFFLVTRMDSNPLFSTPFSAMSSASITDYTNTDSFVALENSGADWSAFHGNNNRYFSTLYLPAMKTPFIVSSILSGNTNTAYLNGNAADSSSQGPNFNFNVSRIYLGTRYENNVKSVRYDGAIGEIIIFNRNLTVLEHKEILSYLSKKWGIKLNLNF